MKRYPRVPVSFLRVSLIFLLIMTIFISLPKVSAEGTYVDSDITKDTTWSKEGSPYIIIRDISVKENVTLEVKPGVEIRIVDDVSFQILGSLIAKGTSDNPIIIEGQGLKHNWYITIKGKIVLDYVQVPENLTLIPSKGKVEISNSKISGFISISTEPISALYYFSGNISLSSVTANSISISSGSISGNISLSSVTANTISISSVYYIGNISLSSVTANSISISSGSISGNISLSSVTANTISIVGTIYNNGFMQIKNSTIAFGSGIGIGSANGTVEYCNIYGNKPYGLSIGGGFLKAENNWWGDPSGPYHSSINPEGKGDAVNANPNAVDFIPWLKSTVGNAKLPKAILSLSTQTVSIGDELVIDATKSTDENGIKYYYYDFGDGSSTGWTKLPKVVHKYDKTGEYNITLLVVSNSGLMDKAQIKITVVETTQTTTQATTKTTQTTTQATTKTTQTTTQTVSTFYLISVMTVVIIIVTAIAVIRIIRRK